MSLLEDTEFFEDKVERHLSVSFQSIILKFLRCLFVCLFVQAGGGSGGGIRGGSGRGIWVLF